MRIGRGYGRSGASYIGAWQRNCRTLGKTRFTAPLHGIRHGHGPTLRYVYDPGHRHSRHDHRKQGTAVWRYRPPSHQLYNASPVIGIRIFGGQSFSSWFDSSVVEIWLDSICGFDLTRLTCFVFRLESTHVQRIYFRPKSHSSNHIFQPGVRESHIDQGVFEIFQHWNRGIFHNSENWIWVWRENTLTGKKIKNQRS